MKLAFKNEFGEVLCKAKKVYVPSSGGRRAYWRNDPRSKRALENKAAEKRLDKRFGHDELYKVIPKKYIQSWQNTKKDSGGNARAIDNLFHAMNKGFKIPKIESLLKEAKAIELDEVTQDEDMLMLWLGKDEDKYWGEGGDGEFDQERAFRDARKNIDKTFKTLNKDSVDSVIFALTDKAENFLENKSKGVSDEERLQHLKEQRDRN